MKRIVAAVSLATLAVPALALEHGKPTEASPWASDWNFIAPPQ